MIIAKYKANSTDCLPTFNGGYIYTSSYVDNGDGTYTFTLESDNNFTSVHFLQKQSLLSVEKLAVTSSCTGLNNLFNSCSNLTSVNTQGWDTSNVTTFWALCYQCPNLLEIDVSKFDTSNVDNMYAMFYGCNKLTSLDVSNFNTSQVTNMEGIFSACKALTSLDVSNWDTSKVTNMASMFSGCSSLASLDLSSFDTSRVTSMASMFAGCSSLVSLDLSSFNTSKVVNMNGMVRECKSLVKLNLSSFDTSIVTTMYAMFYYSTNLASLDISNFTITDSTNISNIFDALNLSEIGMLYCNKATIDKVTSKLPSSSKSNIYVLDEDISKLNKLDNITFVKALEYEEEITLPYQMAKVDGVKDRLYYDESIGKYILEKNIDEDFNVIEKQVIETDIDLMELDTYDTTYITVTSRLDSELKVNEEYCKLDILSSDGGENSINNELFLNEPLRRIGDVSDRLYWDFTKEKYVIERKFGEVVLNGGENWIVSGNTNTPNTMMFRYNFSLPNNYYYPSSKIMVISSEFKTIGASQVWGNNDYDSEGIGLGNAKGDGIDIRISKSKLPTQDVNGFKQYLKQNPVKAIYELSEPVYEELDINRMDLKSYIPTTHLTTPNIPLKTSITVDTNIAKYKPVELLPDTKYTVLVDAMGGENNTVNIDLGGATNRFKPTQYAYGKNKVSITTPSTLSTDYLSIYGETNKVKDIMLIQGDVNQHPEYFDGTQSTGELQGDGSYKIDILSQSEALDSRDIQGNIPITLEGTNEGKYITIDEIHGNTWQDNENLSDIRSVGELQEDGTYKVDIVARYEYSEDSIPKNEYFKVSDVTLVHNKLMRISSEKFNPVKKFFNQVNGLSECHAIFEYYYVDNNSNVWVNADTSNISLAIKRLNIRIDVNTKSIYLPQPLSMIGEYQDKLYWDDEKGKYCIEQKIGKLTIDENTPLFKDGMSYYAVLDNCGTVVTGFNTVDRFINSYLPNTNISGNNTCYLWRNRIGFCVGNTYSTVDEFKNFLSTNPINVYYIGDVTKTVELDITEKILLDSYNPTTYVTTNSNVEHEIKGLYDEVKSHNVSILLDSPLTNDDKIYYDNGYKVDRNGNIETPVTKGNEINLPKLYQGINTYINTTTGNIKPSEIKVEYKEFK